MSLIGLDAKLYRGTAGSTAATEVSNVKDLSLRVEKGEADVSTRASVWELIKTTLKKGTVEFQMQNIENCPHVAAIASAFYSDTALSFLILDKASGKGVDADFEVVSFGREEPLKEGQTIPVTIKPTYTGIASGRYPSTNY